MAGQTIMQDFVRFRIPLWARRLITMVPAVIVVAMGVDSTSALVMSQVVLSLVLPVPMVALLVLSSRRDIMGSFVSRRSTLALAIIAAAVVLALNLVLLLQTAGMPVSFLGTN
jgi:manganese transport protein